MHALRILPVILAVRVAGAQPGMSPAEQAIREFQKVCDSEGRALWGTSLCGRLLLVDRRTRQTVATFRDPDNKFSEKDGLFFGTLPSSLMLANTSVHWGSGDWAMVAAPVPEDTFERVRLLAHESFHRIQPALHLDTSEAPNAHLDTETGRLWLRMELRALSQGLRLDGNAAREAATDALLFRAARRSLHPGADARESSLEIQEGLAEYTGTVIGLHVSGESMLRVARSIESAEDDTAFARGFAYATGPALGLLLDRYAGAWRKDLNRDSDLSALLASALNFQASKNVVEQAQQHGERYGYRAVATDEQARDQRTQVRLAAFRARFISGPALHFPKTGDLQRTFNPNNLITLGDDGTVYPTGTFTSRWGKLEIDDVGGLLSPDNMSVTVAAPADAAARPVVGPGYRLDLAPGWTIRPAKRSGDFEVVPEN